MKIIFRNLKIIWPVLLMVLFIDETIMYITHSLSNILFQGITLASLILAYFIMVRSFKQNLK